MTKLDIIYQCEKLNILNKIDRKEIATFDGRLYYPIMCVSDLLDLEEREIMSVLKEYPYTSVDLEFQERKDTYVVHDGESATGRPLVMGVTWAGLKCLTMEMDDELMGSLARDLIVVEFEESNPKTMANYYMKTKARSIGLKK
ncbi:MAG: hypothetical protein ACQETE_10030 [Bacteroidota bacterium]